MFYTLSEHIWFCYYHLMSEVKISLQGIQFSDEFIYTILQYTDLQSFPFDGN